MTLVDGPAVAIEHLLKEKIGLDAASVGPHLIARAIAARLAVHGAQTLQSYYDHLRSSDAEICELIESVIVPETSFFRERASFVALADLAINEWARRNSTGVLRVLSAPCSTGEEPFSIAVALLDAGFALERFTIDALDISARALQVAERASYHRNCFRNQELPVRQHYFHLTTADRYEVAKSIRAAVHFQQGNLLASELLPGKSYDIIFCRNLLIYFAAPARVRVLKTLDRLLAPDGLLFVGASEGFVLREAGFNSLGPARAFAYSRPGPVEMRRTAPPQHPQSKTAQAAPIELETARALADSGRLAEAARACEAHLRDNGVSAAGYYLLGVVRDAMGDQARARQLYRKALYLQPDHLEALAHLALLSGRAGDLAFARRLQQRAQRAAGAAKSTPLAEDAR